jgi:hypothetical protein
MPSDLALFEAVRRGGLRPDGSWTGILSPAQPQIEELLDEALAQGLPPFQVLDASELEPFPLAKRLRDLDPEPVLLHGLEHWPAERWRAAELNRNAWLREAPLWLLLGPEAAAAIARHAPNVRSLIGPYLVLRPDAAGMEPEERQSRLAQLREHYGKTDAEIIEAKIAGTLELSPHMVEWLILLDRGDLV